MKKPPAEPACLDLLGGLRCRIGPGVCVGRGAREHKANGSNLEMFEMLFAAPLAQEAQNHLQGGVRIVGEQTTESRVLQLLWVRFTKRKNVGLKLELLEKKAQCVLNHEFKVMFNFPKLSPSRGHPSPHYKLSISETKYIKKNLLLLNKKHFNM